MLYNFKNKYVGNLNEIDSLYIDGVCNFNFKHLKLCDGICIINNHKMDKYFYKKFPKSHWKISEKSSDFIVDKHFERIIYSIDNDRFEKDMFIKIRKDLLTVDEVFNIESISQLKIAYKHMDKSKLIYLKDLKLLYKVDDSFEMLNSFSFNIQL